MPQLQLTALRQQSLEEKFGLTLKDLSIFLPIEKEALEDFNLDAEIFIELNESIG